MVKKWTLPSSFAQPRDHSGCSACVRRTLRQNDPAHHPLLGCPNERRLDIIGQVETHSCHQPRRRRADSRGDPLPGRMLSAVGQFQDRLSWKPDQQSRMAEAGLERTLKAPWSAARGTAEPAVNGRPTRASRESRLKATPEATGTSSSARSKLCSRAHAQRNQTDPLPLL
jgi:hypothetical protein